MVYDWDQHKDVCFQLYIKERKSLEDIMQYFREHHDFTPSKRAFQTQFKRWEFPSKQNPAHRNMDLVARVKELWEQNYSQRDMLRTLNEEGFELKERELMRVRAKNRWLLRIPNGQKPTPEEDALQLQLLEAAGIPVEIATKSAVPASAEVPDDILRKRRERHDQLQAESDERWASKKRRRRTREYAGLAADPPGPPRFPSETTLGESMEYLSLSNETYKQVRQDFQRICEEKGIVKKTLAGTDKWQAVKDQVIHENESLRTAFADERNRQAKELALDVICTDVTKRMRTVETRMTIVDAKNTLGINPEQSRQIRNGFYTILQNDHFISKLETGPEHWQALKDQWIAETPLLQQLLAPGDADSMHERRKKALEVLCRDVMKRLRDAQKKGKSDDSPIQVSKPPPLPTFDLGDLQIDPSLLQAADFTASPIIPTAVYIKPHPKSQVYANAKMWLGTLMTRTFTELENLVKGKWPNVIITRVDGIAKDSSGREIPFLIEGDDELDAYLDHVQSSKVVFVVQMNAT